MKAGLLERPRRGHLRIAARGLDVLRRGGPPQVLDVHTAEQTPEEQLEAGYLRHHDGLASEVLARVRK